eukprot:5444780-Heterocapsa_arctica.AAC.1
MARQDPPTDLIGTNPKTPTYLYYNSVACGLAWLRINGGTTNRGIVISLWFAMGVEPFNQYLISDLLVVANEFLAKR